MRASARYKQGGYNHCEQEWQPDGSVILLVEVRGKRAVRCHLEPTPGRPDEVDTTKWRVKPGSKDEEETP